MASDNLRKRIEALNRRPLKNVPEEESEEAPEMKALRRKLEKRTPKPEAASDLQPVVQTRAVPSMPTPSRPYSERRDFGPAITLEEAIDGVVTGAPAGPGYYMVEKPAAELEAEADIIHRRFSMIAGHAGGAAAERILRACKSENIPPEEIVFLDLETTGLSMTPVFLIGTMECRDHGFVFRQYLARDYSEEVSILSAFAERLKGTKLLVTFNGKCFDVPYLESRAIATGVRLACGHHHLDLLHEARRIYRGTLPNCRLQTLEQMVCGRYREDDIPGAEIPQAYHDFVRTGNANKIGMIMQHNLYDLLTMADLMHRMWHRD